MDKIFSCVAFFWVTWNFGCLISSLDKEQDGFEKHFMRIGAGLALMIVSGFVLNLLHIPLDVLIFFMAATVIAIVRRIRCHPDLLSKIPVKISREDWNVLFMAGGLFLIFFAGAIHDPLLEDDDPWAHAAGVAYIAVEKNLNPLPGEFHYINPYPPGYDLIMGVLHQTSLSMVFTLKFFNALFIALGIVFFYFFAARIFQDKMKATLAVFILVCIPCYLTRFIWAHALAVSLFPVVFYFLMRYWEDKKFLLASVLCLAAVFFTQPDESIKLAGMLLIMGWAFCHLRKGAFKKTILSIVLAGMVSMLWWGPVLLGCVQKKTYLAIRMGKEISGYTQAIDRGFLKTMFSPAGGIEPKIYTAKDLLIPGEFNKIDAAIGWGFAIAFLTGLGLFILFQRTIPSRRMTLDGAGRLTLGWFLFTLLGISTPLIEFPVGLFPYRFWIILAFPVALLSAYGMESVGCLRFGRIFLRIIVLFVLLTAAYPKVLYNIACWGQGSYWNSKTEISGYILLQQKLAPGTRVFAFTENLFVIGADMRADFWTSEYKDSFFNAFEFSAEELYQRLKTQDYRYIIVSERDIERFGRNAVVQKISGMLQGDRFKMFHQIDGRLWILKVV